MERRPFLSKISSIAVSQRVSKAAGKLQVLHAGSVHPARSNRIALQFLYARDHYLLRYLHMGQNGGNLDVAWNCVEVQSLPHWPKHKPNVPYLLRRARSLIRRVVNSVNMHLRLLRSRADLMHAHEHSSLWPLAFWVIVLRRQAIWDPHDYFRDTRDGQPHSMKMQFRFLLERAVVTRGTPILVVSDGIRDLYKKLYPEAQVVVIKNYSSQRHIRTDSPREIEIQARKLVEKRGNIENTVLRLVHPGLINPNRFSLDLIKAIGAIKGITLDIYGEDRSTARIYENQLIRVLSDNNIANVSLKGAYASDSIVEILTDYHFVLLPFLTTRSNINLCLPNKFFQCIEAGLPLITSSMKELGGIITRHGLGYIYKAGDNAACIDVIKSCGSNADEYLQLVRNTLNYRSNEIDYAQQRSALLETYSLVMGKS
jgi:glycosyltransferase involved in cell wall biosynthesis